MHNLHSFHCKILLRLVHLETERVNYEHKVNDQKYELGTLRHRVNDLINKSGKSKQPRVGKLKIPAK